MPPVYSIITIVLLLSLNILFLYNIILLPHRKNKKEEEVKKEINVTELSQYVFVPNGEDGVVIYRSVLNMIDNFIDEALNTYFKLEAPEEDHYITREESTNISKYLLASVSKNMTPSVIHTLSLVYNINTDEELTKFLKLRIKLRMIDLIVNVNRPIE